MNKNPAAIDPYIVRVLCECVRKVTIGQIVDLIEAEADQCSSDTGHGKAQRAMAKRLIDKLKAGI